MVTCSNLQGKFSESTDILNFRVKLKMNTSERFFHDNTCNTTLKSFVRMKGQDTTKYKKSKCISTFLPLRKKVLNKRKRTKRDYIILKIIFFKFDFFIL